MKTGELTLSRVKPSKLRAYMLYDDFYEISLCIDVLEIKDTIEDDDKMEISYSYNYYSDMRKITNYGEMVSALINLLYTNGDEIALERKGHENPDLPEYIKYLAYVEECKEFARQFEEIGGNRK